ncbi:MAG: hypothetical protein JWP01_1721 [Myxococcales bacterium]|nr:hypothetical protein [Myxococcales bacterium]
MATHDNDFLTGPVPEPEAEATSAERAYAKTFADVVDKTLSGRAPAAMSADDRALIEVATVIRAANGTMELAPSKQRSIIEDALRQAVGTGASTSGSVTPIARGRAKRWVPWTVAAMSTLVAAAAILLLWLRVPTTTVVQAPQAAAVPTSWTSRPADPLIGPIAREHAGDASSRIDYLFADRLDGFRERRLSGGKP